MRKVLILATISLMLISCGGKRKQAQSDEAIAATTVAEANKSYNITELFENAEDLVDKTVTVRGFVSHTCKHSGKRCFLVGEDPNLSLRIEATGNIGGFNRELIGSELAITGILKERRLSEEYLDHMTKEVTDKQEADEISMESCETELANIEGMKRWMEENDKEYYSVYYMDGEEYEVIEE